VQEAFTRAWPRWETISRYDNPATWVRRVAMNVATSRWRPARAHSRHHREAVAEGPGPDRVAARPAHRSATSPSAGGISRAGLTNR
jgi:RNA polymerase sigma-70 factor (ECF subfamily)